MTGQKQAPQFAAMATNNNTSSTDLVEPGSVEYRITRFYVSSYSTRVNDLGHVGSEQIQFLTSNAFRFKASDEFAAVDVAITILDPTAVDASVPLCTFVATTEFGIRGLMTRMENAEEKTDVPEMVVRSLLSVAISTSRGALSVLSGEKWLLPIMDVSTIDVIGQISQSHGVQVSDG